MPDSQAAGPGPGAVVPSRTICGCSDYFQWSLVVGYGPILNGGPAGVGEYEGVHVESLGLLVKMSVW